MWFQIPISTGKFENQSRLPLMGAEEVFRLKHLKYKYCQSVPLIWGKVQGKAKEMARIGTMEGRKEKIAKQRERERGENSRGDQKSEREEKIAGEIRREREDEIAKREILKGDEKEDKKRDEEQLQELKYWKKIEMRTGIVKKMYETNARTDIEKR